MVMAVVVMAVMDTEDMAGTMATIMEITMGMGMAATAMMAMTTMDITITAMATTTATVVRRSISRASDMYSFAGKHGHQRLEADSSF